MADSRHSDWAEFVMNLLKTQDLGFIKPDEIYITRFPFHKQPSTGLAISPLDESEGVGLNDRDDIRYPLQLTRIKPRIHKSDGIKNTSEWRTIVRELFNRKRLGFHAQEMITTVKHDTIFIPKSWSDWNIEASVMRVTVLIREVRQ